MSMRAGKYEKEPGHWTCLAIVRIRPVATRSIRVGSRQNRCGFHHCRWTDVQRGPARRDELVRHLHLVQKYSVAVPLWQNFRGTGRHKDKRDAPGRQFIGHWKA